MKKEPIVFLQDILKNIEFIETFTDSMSRETFFADVKTQYSVIRGIEVMGEATKNLPKSLTDKYPDIPWKDIAGMRDKLIHAYFGVKSGEVWRVVKDDLPVLKKKIQKIKDDIKHASPYGKGDK